MLFNQQEVAIHESGHVVIAGLLKVPVIGVKIERCERSEDWHGEAFINFSVFPDTSDKCTEEQRIGYRATRMAGPFAQFLYCGRKPGDPRWLPDFAASVGARAPSPLTTKRSEYDNLLNCVTWCFCAAYRNPNLVVPEGFEEVKTAAELAFDLVKEHKQEIESLAEHIIANAGHLDEQQLKEWRT